MGPQSRARQQQPREEGMNEVLGREGEARNGLSSTSAPGVEHRFTQVPGEREKQRTMGTYRARGGFQPCFPEEGEVPQRKTAQQRHRSRKLD